MVSGKCLVTVSGWPLAPEPVSCIPDEVEGLVLQVGSNAVGAQVLYILCIAYVVKLLALLDIGL